MINVIENHTTQSIETLKNMESNIENVTNSVAQYKTEVTSKVQHIHGNFFQYYFTIFRNFFDTFWPIISESKVVSDGQIEETKKMFQTMMQKMAETMTNQMNKLVESNAKISSDANLIEESSGRQTEKITTELLQSNEKLTQAQKLITCHKEQVNILFFIK